VTPYGCFDRKPFRPVHAQQDGWRTTNFTRDGATREPVLVAVPFRNRPDCVYTTSNLGAVDPRCAGCCHRQINDEGKP
jgi:hypothetical protein